MTSLNPYILLFFNTLTLTLALIVNFLGGSGILTGKDVGEISRQYEILITPASYAFSIWGLIYLQLITFVCFQWYSFYKNKDTDDLQKSFPWFSLSNLANAGWILAWTSNEILLSVVIIFILLFALIMLIRNYAMELWDAPLSIIVFVWWPIVIYTGWVILAAVVNVAAYLYSAGILLDFFSAQIWTVIMIGISSVIYMLLIYFRNMREAAIVGIWGLSAIAVKQWDAHPEIVYAAIIACVMLFFAVNYHVYLNRKTLPHQKLGSG